MASDADVKDEPDEPDDEHTYVVDRSVGDEDDAEHTVVVQRARKADAVEDEDEAEHTVAVKRARKADAVEDEDEAEHTVVVKRARKDDAVEDDGEDHTVVVGRKAAKPSLASTPAAKRRRGIALPPVPEGFAPGAIDAIGPNAEITYAPRAIPDLPAAPPEVAEGPAATRAAAPFMPSVLRRGQRTAHITVIVFVATCIASVVGLSLIALAVF